MWDPEHRETEEELKTRLSKALDEVLLDGWDSTCESSLPEGNSILTAATVISITSHSGAIRAMLRVIGRTPVHVETGGKF